MEKILITGANGLLGQKLVRLIAPMQSYEIIATGRGANRIGEANGPYTYISMDITQAEEVEHVFSLCNPDYIIHTAAMTNVDQCEADKENCDKQNVYAVQYLTDAASRCGAFFLHLSTDFIFDGTKGPLTEEDIPNPISYYGLSKLKAEQIVAQCRIPWAIARTVLVYGWVPNMSRSNIILWVKKSLEEGKNIQVVDDQWRTPTLAEDLAMGCLLIVQKKAMGIFHISGCDYLTPYQMAILTAEYFGLDKTLITRADSSTFTQPAKRPPCTGFVIDKAKHVLGYQPHTFSQGLAILAGQLQGG
ncbi:MAG: SDR family oxidoreductase [Cytophagaceae bacterium]|nr:SDR family oxidoreductase [Cytophagaceae bacterium]MDW8456384.1 SDR family oxidoreductase [Cytophagaceae bacterium]